MIYGVSADIFKSYDIRGKYPREISEKDAFLIGRAFFIFLKNSLNKKPKVSLAFDSRSSSKALASGFKTGFESGGGKVAVFGYLTSPAFYFATLKNKFDAGAIVTASHLGKNFNGIKFIEKNGRNIGLGSGLEKIRRIAEEIKIQDLKVKIGRFKILPERKLVKEWLNFNLGLSRVKKIKTQLKIAFDLGNSPLALYQKELKAVLKKIGISRVYFCGNNNFNFPKNPLKPKFQREIKKLILRDELDFGFAFDADGDRILVFDNKAKLIEPDFLAALLINNCGFKNIVVTQPTSLFFRNFAKKAGVKILITKVGHTFVKEKMQRGGSDFAFEVSGHFYLKQKINNKAYYFEAPLAVLFMSLVALVKPELKQLLTIWRENTAVQTLDLKLKKYNLNSVVKYFKNKADIFEDLDGFYFGFHNFWFNIRKSNTENVIRLRIGGEDKNEINQTIKIIKKLLE